MGSAISTVSAAAVNTYFRAELAEQVNRADFEPREYAQLANYQAPTASKCTQHSLTTEQTNLENIPSSVLEHVLQHANLYTVCSAALASRSLCKVKLVTSIEKHAVELAGCMCHIQGVYAAAHLVSSPDGMLQWLTFHASCTGCTVKHSLGVPVQKKVGVHTDASAIQFLSH